MELEGTHWTVTHIGGEPVIEGSEPTIAFEGGRVAGTTGCNRWFSAYQVEGDAISMGPAGSTMMWCPDPGVMDQEQNFLRSLELIGSLALGVGSLTLMDSQGAAVLVAQSCIPEADS